MIGQDKAESLAKDYAKKKLMESARLDIKRLTDDKDPLFDELDLGDFEIISNSWYVISDGDVTGMCEPALRAALSTDRIIGISKDTYEICFDEKIMVDDYTDDYISIKNDSELAPIVSIATNHVIDELKSTAELELRTVLNLNDSDDRHLLISVADLPSDGWAILANPYFDDESDPVLCGDLDTELIRIICISKDTGDILLDTSFWNDTD